MQRLEWVTFDGRMAGSFAFDYPNTQIANIDDTNLQAKDTSQVDVLCA